MDDEKDYDLFAESELPCALEEIVDENFPNRIRGGARGLWLITVEADNTIHFSDCIIFTSADYDGKRRVTGICFWNYIYSVLGIDRRKRYYEADELLQEYGFLRISDWENHLVYRRNNTCVDILCGNDASIERIFLYRD